MDRLAPLEPLIRFGDGPDADWKVVSFALREALNAVYDASVEIETDEVRSDFGALLGATCELVLQRGERVSRVVHGVVDRVAAAGHDEHILRVRVEIVPAFSLARQRRSSRVWQDRSVQEIITEVLAATLDEYGRSVELGHLQRGAQARDYCVQYRETDHDFVTRLLEEEGISWFFRHDEDRGHEVLTLCDDNEDYPTFANVDGTALVPIVAHDPDEAELESIQLFEWSRELSSTGVTLREFDSASPKATSSASQDSADARGRSRLIHEYETRRPGPKLDRRAQDMQEALAMSGSLASCETNAASLALGHEFQLEGLDHPDAPSRWIALALSHTYQRESQAYRSHLSCVPASTPLRPVAATDRPRIPGPQTATVIGSGEIDVDAQGRILVAFHWQEPGDPAGSSCRVRCAQSWAGPGWGAQFIPRVGMEVVVEFLDGDPDRPLVKGCVYNGANEPPFALPGDSTQSGWRSQSSPGGGSNELRFEDAAGSEQIYVHGQKDWLAQINHDASTSVGHDQQLSVGHDRETTIAHDRRERVGSDQTTVVGAKLEETVGASMRVEVSADQSVSVGGARQLSVAKDLSVSVGASASESVATAKTVTVTGALATIVGAAMNTSVGGLSSEEVAGLKSVTVGLSSSESVVGSKSVDAAAIDQSARADLSLSAGAGASMSAGQDVSFDAGGDLSIRSGKGQLTLDEELTIQVGEASITLKKSGEIVLTGLAITVKGKKSINLSSKKIDQN